MSFWTSGESLLRPMRRLTPKTVFSGFVTACRLAIWPTNRSPPSVIATMEGVVRPPSALVITLASPLSMIATHELVVPRSIPIILLIVFPPRLGEMPAGCVIVSGRYLILSSYLTYLIFYKFLLFSNCLVFHYSKLIHLISNASK